MLQATTIKPKRCKHCRDRFTPARPLQQACSGLCAAALARKVREKAEAKKAAEERKDLRERRERLKTRSDWTKEAQRSFNAWIRARDAGRPCICCGQPFESDRLGGAVDAGHYLSVGSAPNLRFVEDNVHAQRKNCNRPGGTTRASFRAGMIERIGLARVEALEADQLPRHYSVDDLKEIKRIYSAMRRELEKS
jgi:hypothetical protein